MFKERILSILSTIADVDFVVEIPDEQFGDFSTNIAFKLASVEKKSPIVIANNLKVSLQESPLFSEVTVVNGFINFRLSDQFYIDVFNELSFTPFEKRGEKVLVEFGSANPTGPLHIGHGIQLVIGDVTSSLLSYAGYDVTREYYINDDGVQIDKLVDSFEAKLNGREIAEDGYQGDYIDDMVKEYDGSDSRSYSINWAMSNIRDTLSKIGIEYDSWVSERELYDRYSFTDTLNSFNRMGLVYLKEGAVWLRTSDFGDDKDRVVIKGDGNRSYFASDILYSRYKVDRSFDKIVTILGADHHGYVDRYLSTFNMFGFKGDLPIMLIQLVSLNRSGELVRMSKRAGNYYSFNDLIEEVGSDACRVFFLTRKSDTAIDFDIDLAKKRSSDNPLFYLQYAYARISSILSDKKSDGVLSSISTKEEKRLLKKLSQFKEIIEVSVEDLDMHRLFKYAYDLSSIFHSFYSANRISDSLDRVAIIIKVRECLKEILGIFKVSTPESM